MIGLHFTDLFGSKVVCNPEDNHDDDVRHLLTCAVLMLSKRVLLKDDYAMSWRILNDSKHCLPMKIGQ